ncbi:germin-like protein subfamily T member 2 [Selaginella moellendorffii]|uniref:germin-like protein subfamily T member 2 n=1 Tax=Selaginella moellendorffii TaxID=88036 RepID=UPI000D1C5015|nr:germin-like protein subfamily T member 2 [Selaginella moellendorffii]|eukprot:XP_024516022.1 germin-like protein subfamily T member 2 [Selaginella moellendorffii]
MVYVEEGTVYAAIVTADNRLFARVMNRGEVMVIPRGLIHWQMNVGRTNAKIIATLNSQLPGIQFIARSMFGSRPEVPDEVLEKTFFLDERGINQVRSNFTIMLWHDGQKWRIPWELVADPSLGGGLDLAPDTVTDCLTISLSENES